MFETLPKKCQNTEFFLVHISPYWTEYGDLLCKSPYSLRIRKNTEQKNSIFGHFSHNSRDIRELVFYLGGGGGSQNLLKFMVTNHNRIVLIYCISVFIMPHTRLEWIYILQLPECQGAPCSKQARYLKFKWLQRDSNWQTFSS